MPLTLPETYPLSHLRLDGRRWNELRLLTSTLHVHTSSSTFSSPGISPFSLSTLTSGVATTSIDGSSYIQLGNTRVLCTVSGPAELPHKGRSERNDDECNISCEVHVPGFGASTTSGGGGVATGGGDRRTTELNSNLADAFDAVVMKATYPRSTLVLSFYILSQDGSVLATLLNAGTLALVDAGVPLKEYLVACTAGSIPPLQIGRGALRSKDGASNIAAMGSSEGEPILDLSGSEEMECPFLTVATLGASEKVVVLNMETKVHIDRLEGMLAVGVDGCKQVREVLDGIVRRYAKTTARKMDGNGML